MNSSRRERIGIGIVLIISGMLFYWYGYRPTSVRRECAAAAEKSLVTTENAPFDAERFAAKHDARARDSYIDRKYRDCIRQRGLNE